MVLYTMDDEVNMSYKIELDNFIGPFDLLFDLISKDEIDIYNIPIHKITGDFIKAINDMDSDAKNIAEFISFASLLLEIKSKMLLPDYKLVKTDLLDENDPRKILVERLIEYQLIKKKKKELGKIYEDSFPRVYSENINIKLNINKKRLLDYKVDINALISAYRTVLLKQERFNEESEFFEKFSKQKYSVEDKHVYIKKLIDKYIELEFKMLLDGEVEKEEKIATFLAVLKMWQEQDVILKQDEVFDNILIERRTQ